MINNNNMKNSPCTQLTNSTKDNNLSSNISFYVLSNILFGEQLNISQSNDIDDLSMLCDTRAPSACPSEVSDDDDIWSIESQSSSNKKKNVRFAEEIVSDVRTRPRTPPELVGSLFYNAEEISNFREQYYAYLDEQEEEQPNEVDENEVMPGYKKFVSKVCALHDGQVHMYHEDNADALDFDHPSFWNGSLTWWY